MAKRKSKKEESTSSSPEPQAPPQPDTWDEKLIEALRPWGREIGGALLFMMGVLTLAGLIGFISTTAVSVWSNLWWLWLGWISIPTAIYIGALGLYLATQRIENRLTIPPTRLVGIGLLLLACLPLVHMGTGTTLAESQLGFGGGRLGFALAEPVIFFFGTAAGWVTYIALLAYSITLIMLISRNRILKEIRRASWRIREWAQTVSPEGAPVRTPRPVIDRKRLDDMKETEPKVVIPAKRPARRKKKTGPVEVKRRHPMLPSIDLLERGSLKKMSPEEIEVKRKIIQQTLDDFSIPAEVLPDPLVGPAVTQFAVVPGYVERQLADGSVQKIKMRINKIASLDKDMALALSAPRIRIQAPVPGQGIVGIEVPNNSTSMVRMGTIIESAEFQRKASKSSMGIALGLDVSGTAVATDTTKLPHMLVAGQTGSGKSVFMNAIISCLVFNNTPDELQLIMIDPKKVELIRFNGLPHVLGKVETDAERAIGVLRWLTAEMDDRYSKLAELGARNIRSYNEQIKKYKEAKPMPFIVALIDELADLMVQYGAELEQALCRLAQMARATGIHLIVATQRPSTDVLTGLIKANFPSRSSFAVASGTDSRVIIDSTGAETLLGKGDMLFLGSDANTPQRVQGCFVSDEEIDRLVKHWETTWPQTRKGPAPWDNLIERNQFLEKKDDLLERAIALTQKHDSISTSMLQRRLRIGFPRAANLMEQLFEMGLVDDPQRGGVTRKTKVDDTVDDPLRQFLDKHGEEYVDYPDKPNFDN